MQAAENDEKRNQGQTQPTVDPGSGYQHGTVRKPSILDGPVETKSEDQQILQQDAMISENCNRRDSLDSFVVIDKDGDSSNSDDGICFTQYRKHFESSAQEHQERKDAVAAVSGKQTLDEFVLEKNPEERGRAFHQNPAVPGDPDIRSSPKGQNTQTPDTTEYEIRGSPGMVTTGRRPTDGLATSSPTDANQKSPSGRTTGSPATNLTDLVGLPRMVSPGVDIGHYKDQTGIPKTEYDLTPYPNYTGSGIPQYDVEYDPNRNPDYVGGKTSTPDKHQPLQYPAGNNQTPRYQGQTIPRNIGYPAAMNQQYPPQMNMNPTVNQTDSYSLDSNRGSQDESLPDIYRSGLPGKQQRDPEMSDNMNSSDTPNVNATIKVSGYPESFDLNVLGMYVESEKRFGARVNSIEQRRTYILVNVPSIEDAERVCSKEHNLLDCNLQLEIYSPESEQVATRVKVTGYPPTFPMDILEMYLENERGIGAKTENIAIDKAGGCAYVTVSSLADAERICEQKHEVYGCQLTVEICRPEEEKKAQEILRLVVSGYPESFDLSILEMYLENEKRLGAKAEKVEVGKGQSFVTLSCLDDIELVCKKQHKLADYVLNIEVYQPQSTIDKTARTVKVSGYSSSLNEEILQLFFESEKKFGAKCEELKIDAAKGCSFVTLSSVQDVEKVLSEERRLGNMPLTIKKMQKDISKEKLMDSKTLKISGDLELEKIRKYINNTKKFGVKPLFIETRDGCLIVTLSSSEDVVYILKKKHVVRDCNLTLELLDNPSSEESDEADEDDDEESGSDDSDDSEKVDRNIIRISGYKNVDKLKKYVTNVKKFGVNCKQLEIVDDNVLVTLHDQKDVDTVLERKHTIKGCELKVEVLGNSDQSSDSSNSISDEDTSAKTCVVKVSGSNKMKILKEYVNNEEAFGAKIIDMKVDKTSKCIYATLATRQEAVKVCAKERGKIRVELAEHQTSGVKNDISESDKDDAIPKNSKSKSNDTEKENGDECKHYLRIDGADIIAMEIKVRFYIENRKKFGASAENIEFDEDDNCAYVTVSSKKDALEVCERSHAVNNKDLNVEICTPPPDDTRRFLITNLSDETSKDTLINYIESKLDVDVVHILYSVDAKRALIQYDQRDTTFADLKERIRQMKTLKLDEKILKIECIKASKIVITDFSETEYGREYFERIGPVLQLDAIGDQQLRITFKNYEDAEKALKESHKFKMNIHHKCLGEDGGIEDPHVFIKPENATMEMSEADRYKLEFIHQTDSNLDDFKCYMSKSHTVVEWDRAGLVYLVCTLTKDVKDARKLAKTWRKATVKQVEKYLGGIRLNQFSKDQEILDEVYKKMPVTQPNVVNITKGKTPMTMVVVGRDGNIFEDTIKSIDEVIRQTEAEIERKRQEITKTVSTKYPYSLLEKFGLIDDTKAKWPHLEISSSGQESKDVYVKGLVGDVSEAEDFLNEIASQIKVKTLSFADDDSVTLLTNQEVVDYIISEHLNKQKNMAIWTRNHGDQPDVEVIAKDEQCLNKISEILHEVVTRKTIDYDPESKEIFESTEWKELFDKIQKEYRNLFLINLETEGNVIVTAVTELIDVVVPGIEDFISTKKIYTETISFNRGQNYILENFMKKETEELIGKLGKSVKINRSLRTISIEGQKQDVNKARSELAGHLERITETEMKITDEIELGYFQSEEGFNATNDITNGYIERSDETVYCCASFTHKNSQIDIVEGDANGLDVEVIVGAFDPKEENIRNGDDTEDFAGKVKVERSRPRIVPLALHKCSGIAEMERCFKQSVMEAMKQLSIDGIASVALPVRSPASWDFPLHVLAKTLVQAISDFEIADTGIKRIYLVDKAETNFSVMYDHLKESSPFKEKQPKQIITHPPRPRRDAGKFSQVENKDDMFQPTILKGEIAKAKTDVIVNSSNTKLGLHNGAISSSILKAAGKRLQHYCNRNYPRGINYGDVAITLACGDLKSKAVFHTCLKNANEANKEQDLRQLILYCLGCTEYHNYKSISFPAIGTGVLQYPASVVAKIFKDTIHEYISQGGKLSASDIHIVLYPTDIDTIKAFAKEMGLPENPEEDTGSCYLSVADIKKGIQIGNLNFKVLQGSVIDRHVAAIVNSTNAQLDLSKGAVSKQIYEMAGSALTGELKKQFIKMKERGVIVTPVTGMNCHSVIHIDMLRYQDKLIDGITKCLQMADDKKLTSVSFPALGTGYGSSVEEIAHAFFASFVDIGKDLQNVKTVEIMLYLPDAYEYFATVMLQLAGAYLSPTTHRQSTREKLASAVGGGEKPSDKLPVRGAQAAAPESISEGGDRQLIFRIYSLGNNKEIERKIKGFVERATEQDKQGYIEIKSWEVVEKRTGEEDNAERCPRNWITDGKGEKKLIEVDRSSQEYRVVEMNFNSTFSGRGVIVEKIERLENISFYEQYTAKRDGMMKELPSSTTDIEREILWYGGTDYRIDDIVKYGFGSTSYTTSYSTVKFSVDSSNVDLISTTNSQGLRKMFQCRVLVGVISDRLCNTRRTGCSVDNIENPKIFTVLRDSRAYPEYLITYKLTYTTSV